MKVIPLGTSSGKPTLRRNVSALAVVREGEWLLFDCGEGTQTQIARAGLHPNRLAAIFITHLHGDHFNGVSGLLATMGMDRRTKELTLVGPTGIAEYLDTLARLKILQVNYPLEVKELSPARARSETVNPRGASDSIGKLSRKFYGPSGQATPLAGDKSSGASMDEQWVVYDTEEYVVTTRPLDHRVFTLGYRVQERPRPGRFNVERARALGIPEGPMFGRLQSGHSIQLDDGRAIHPCDVLGPERPGKAVAYCTDTRPCEAAAALGRNTDLLIHEATFTDDLAAEANDFGHSTAAQAARTARRAGARRLLITHFSTRYPDARLLIEEAQSVFPETILAEELAQFEV
jgi:ribonuclease Z